MNMHPCEVICQKLNLSSLLQFYFCPALEQRNENMQCYGCNWVTQFVDTF